MSPESVKDVFRVLDVDGSGFIEEDELKWDPHTDTPAPDRTNSPLLTLIWFCGRQVRSQGLFQGGKRSHRRWDESVPQSCRQRWRWQDWNWWWERSSALIGAQFTQVPHLVCAIVFYHLQSLRSWCMSKDPGMTAFFLVLFFLTFTCYNRPPLPQHAWSLTRPLNTISRSRPPKS